MKRRWIRVLTLANIVLALALVATRYELPVALAAQADVAAAAPGLASRFIAVAGEVQDQHDAIYVLDTKAHSVHVFIFDRSMRRLTYTTARDLEADFRNN